MPQNAHWSFVRLFGCFTVLFASCCTLLSAAPRQKTLLDADWRFYRGDLQGAEAVQFHDAGWERIGLPHSFGIPYFADSKFYVGYGWYRRHVALGPVQPGQRISIEFEAAFQDAEVFVNGNRIGEHLGGYTGFAFDITRAVHGGDNVIAVRVNNKWNAQLNPRAGEHNFNGGIYRNVYLVTTSDLHVDWYGTFVTTPGLKKEGGAVHIATDVRNDSNRPRRFVLVTDVMDSANRKVATVRSEEEVAANATSTFQQTTPFIPQPELWSPAHPNMYFARTQILEHSSIADLYETPFGFRWIRWTADQGFFLNGEHYYFHGADVHQDHAGWGDAVTNSGIARDVRLVKQAGMDFIRGSHYPHSPVFSDECDRQGVLLWEENAFWGTGGAKVEGFWTADAYPPNEKDQKPFEESVKRSLAEMIRIHRNHPSIVAWSMTNEVFFTDGKYLPQIRTFLSELVDESHRLDPTRPAGAGGVQRGELDKIADIAGYNGDGATLFIKPGVPSVVTEYGSVESVRPGAYDPGWGDIGGQPEFPWRSGQALWCAFDHGSLFPSLGRMGMIDYFRLPKSQWYWYRNSYTGIAPPEPAKPGTPVALKLSTDTPSPIRADGTGDDQILVSVLDTAGRRISNSPPVRLEIVSGPGEFPTGRSIQFAPDSDIVIRDGEAAIEMRAYQSGPIHLRATSPGLRPADLMVRAAGGPAFVAGATPVAQSRPYVIYRDSTRAETAPIDISLNRPTSASSSVADHTSQKANDGDPQTYWQPDTTASGNQWWQVDFESRCTIKAIHLSFSRWALYRYAIQTADKEGNWTTLIDRGASSFVANEYSETIPDGAAARFMRVTFFPFADGSSVSLGEVKVLGTPIQ